MQFLFIESSEPKNCALASYYTASSGTPYRCFGTTCQSHPQGSRTQILGYGFFNPEVGTKRLFQNVGKKLPLVAV